MQITHFSVKEFLDVATSSRFIVSCKMPINLEHVDVISPSRDEVQNAVKASVPCRPASIPHMKPPVSHHRG